MAENKKFTKLINSDGTKQAVALDKVSFDEQTKKLTLYSSVDNSIKEETTIPASEVDTTLSKSGLAADAKVTGNAVKDVVKVGGTASSFTGIIVGTQEEEVELVEQKDFDAEIAKLNAKVGTPLVANTASAMVNTTKIYVYTGNESGYVNGNWYFYNGTNWESGGVYNAVAVQTDKTLTQENVPADAKKTGDEIEDLKNTLSEKLANIATTWVGANILSPSLIIDGYFISRSDGTLAANAGYFVSDFIEVTGGATYTFCTWTKGSAQPQLTRYIALFYNSDKTPISESYVNSTGGRSITITAPESAKYIRVSSTILNIQGEQPAYMLEQTDVITAYAEYETLTVVNDASNILYGKKWVACGDSFTHGDFSGSSGNTLDIGRYKGQNKVYPFFIGNRNNMDIVNEAVNGSTMCLNDGTHNAFSTANGRYTQIPSDADYITLYFGINDGNYSSPIGTIDDADNTTFYGAWNVVLDYLMRNHPYAKIGIIVTNGTSMAYINAEKAVAAKWGIPYLDMNDIQTPVMNRSNNQSISETVRSFRTQMFSVNAPTNTHPSSKAHEYESTFIEAFLRRL